jgi:acetamidase/formamidase
MHTRKRDSAQRECIIVRTRWGWGPSASARKSAVAFALAVAVGFVALLAAQTPAGKTHRLEATPQTVAYGYYDAAAPPVLTIDSGDIIDVDTLLTNVPDRLERAGVPANQVQQSLRRIVAEVPQNRRGPGGHILTGPVFVRGAEPGDALEVSVLSISLPIAYGYNGCSGFLRDNCEPGRQALIIPLDAKRMIATFPGNVEIPLKPFFGSMGVAPPPSSGRISSNPPWIHAGNLDNKELVAGTTLFIPVHATGALFEIGDGHAAQGDVDQTAIETSLRGRVRLTVRKGMTLAWPRAETPTHYISMGTDEDLTVATRVAIQEMVDFLVATKHYDRHTAYQLTSVAADVAVTQLVDGRIGVHVKMPKSIFKR